MWVGLFSKPTIMVAPVCATFFPAAARSLFQLLAVIRAFTEFQSWNGD